MSRVAKLVESEVARFPVFRPKEHASAEEIRAVKARAKAWAESLVEALAWLEGRVSASVLERVVGTELARLKNEPVSIPEVDSVYARIRAQATGKNEHGESPPCSVCSRDGEGPARWLGGPRRARQTADLGPWVPNGPGEPVCFDHHDESQYRILLRAFETGEPVTFAGSSTPHVPRTAPVKPASLREPSPEVRSQVEAILRGDETDEGGEW